jgi:hypothetical protein
MIDRHDDGSQRAHLSLETSEPMSFGYGFISGLLSALLGIAGFGARTGIGICWGSHSL